MYGWQIKKNLFRSLPPGQRDFNSNYDADEDEPFLEPGWPHLQLVRSSSASAVDLGHMASRSDRVNQIVASGLRVLPSVYRVQ